MTDAPIRVLVVDDTVVYRKAVSELLKQIPGVEVAGVAANGRIALDKINQVQPDLLTLDIEMPELDGLGVLKALQDAGRKLGVIMLSAFTTKGATTTVNALRLGAFDFVVKPNTSSPQESQAILRQELTTKIEAFRRSIGGASRRPSPGRAAPGIHRGPEAPPSARPQAPMQRSQRTPKPSSRPRSLVAIGISTGGPQALIRMLPKLPGDLPAPVLIVQHMPPMFTRSLANDLDGRCSLKVTEAEQGDAVTPGRVLIAPGGKQMKLEKQGGALRVVITDDPPEKSCKPSVDYLFRSVANVCEAGSVVGVIMTGMGNDGALGCRLLNRKDALVIAQDEASCVVYGMPREITEDGTAHVIAPLDEIASKITQAVGRPQLACR